MKLDLGARHIAGRLAIHAAKGFPKWAREICNQSEFAAELGRYQLPTGVVIATCRVVSCIPTRELQLNRVIEMDAAANCADFVMSDLERAFGDYSPGRWAWLLADIEELAKPVPANGSLGLWEWSAVSAVSAPKTGRTKPLGS